MTPVSTQEAPGDVSVGEELDGGTGGSPKSGTPNTANFDHYMPQLYRVSSIVWKGLLDKFPKATMQQFCLDGGLLVRNGFQIFT